MYLSKLEMHGFKSFADKTMLDFDAGITAIVGPNGCGKSNIVDAVRWVIGEQRARILRSDKMENVIFNGTIKRKALGMSEVLLTIENTRNVLPTEYSEVTLGRRLFRSGESEYVMNGVQCRLRDITDLFMDTGMGAGAYSVIELKMIEDILSDNAQDRRHLFEEAAGITKYKLRRRQTINKLDSTRTDLTRLQDLTDEIGKRVRSLQRQAQKAKRYHTYKTRLHEIELLLAHCEYSRLSDLASTLSAEITQLNDRIEQVATQETKEEASLEKLRLESVHREKTVAEHQRILNKHLEKVHHLETERSLNRERLETAIRDVDRLRNELKTAGERREILRLESDDLEKTLTKIRPTLTQAEDILQKAAAARDETRNHADTLRKKLQEERGNEQRAETTYLQCQRGRDILANRLELLEQEQARVETRIRELEASCIEIDNRLQDIKNLHEEVQNRFVAAGQELTDARDLRIHLKQLVDEASDEQRRTERKRDVAAAEVQLLESLISSYDEFPDAVRYLAESPSFDSITELITVADIFACDDSERAALDAALGDLASCIVVNKEEEALQALSLLRSEHKGKASFIVLDRLQAFPTPEYTGDNNLPAGLQSLGQFVRILSPSYNKLAALLLHDRYLVDTLDQARTLASTSPPGSRFFTRNGEWADPTGIVFGGSEEADLSPVATRLGRREQHDAARETLLQLEKLCSGQEENLHIQKTAFDAVPFDLYSENLAREEQALSEVEKQLAQITYQHETFTQQHLDVQSRRDNLLAELTTGRNELQVLSDTLEKADHVVNESRAFRADIEQAFIHTEKKSRVTLQTYNEANVNTVQIRNRCDNLERDLTRAKQELSDLDERSSEYQTDLETLEASIASIKVLLGEQDTQVGTIHKERQDLETTVAYAEEALLQMRDAITSVETELRTIRRNREQLIREENQRAVRLAETKTRCDDLVTNIREEFNVSLAEQHVELEETFDEASTREEVHKLRKSIGTLGAVNELALETYEEEKERLEFLLTQKDDLESAESKLQETIREINTTATERFFETFNAIHENFKQIFVDLFGEDASAYLELTDANDPLESPIDINAKPQGKRPSSIAQLSGGEKALTAIALLFAIYLVKPSPFCILDEVDAPLDDANIGRFMKLIRHFAEDTQFILVTHNKRTMEAADRLYGITMQEQGISRLVGVHFDEAVELADVES